MQTIAYIGLGSNLCEPITQVLTAYASMALMPGCRCLELSPLYQSKAIGPEQPDYINAAAKIETRLSPFALLEELQKIEQTQKRVRNEHWGPRTIDLDILLFGSQSLNTERLTIPHSFIRERNFVLAPLLDLEPTLKIPSGESIASLLTLCSQNELRKLDMSEQLSDIPAHHSLQN